MWRKVTVKNMYPVNNSSTSFLGVWVSTGFPNNVLSESFRSRVSSGEKTEPAGTNKKRRKRFNDVIKSARSSTPSVKDLVGGCAHM